MSGAHAAGDAPRWHSELNELRHAWRAWSARLVITLNPTREPSCTASSRQGTRSVHEQMRMPGVEPGSQAWGACMMPLHYMRCWSCLGPRHQGSKALRAWWGLSSELVIATMQTKQAYPTGLMTRHGISIAGSAHVGCTRCWGCPTVGQ